MINDTLIKEKIMVYSEKAIAVHIIKKDGEWLNGLVKEISDNFLVIDEFKKGVMPVFFVEISRVDTYTKVSENGK